MYAALRSLGRSGVAELVERCCRHARRFSEELARLDGCEILNDVVLNQVLFRFADDETTDAVLAHVQASGEAWMSGTTWDGRSAIRISVSNWRTSDDDVARTVRAFRAGGRRGLACNRGRALHASPARGLRARRGGSSSSHGPSRRLRGLVHGYQGYVETAAPAPVLRQEVPSVRVPLIVNFGARWKDRRQRIGPAGDRDSFVAGIYERSTFVEAEGAATCVQVDFTPIGAHLFFGVPMHELSNRVVDLEDLLGRDRNLAERLEDARPGARASSCSMTSSGRASTARVSRRRRSAGPGMPSSARTARPDVSMLAETVGRSRRHLLHGFREHIGVGPKTAARIIRFSRAVDLLGRMHRLPLVELAQECAYFDQAHMTREFREFAGTTPREFASRLIPGGGVLGRA